MSLTTSNQNLVKALRISAGFFILSALFDILSQFVPSYALFIIWLIVMYSALLAFVYLCYVGGQLSKTAEGNLQGAAGSIVILVILDIILWVGLINFWPIIYGVAGIVIYFVVDILRGIGFTLAFLGLKKLDKSMNNPTYLLYGWGGLVFEILYWITDFDTGMLMLEIEFYVMLVLLIVVAITQFVKANQAKDTTIYSSPSTHATTYTPYQPYQAQQPQQPVKPEQSSWQTSKFCENCGAKLEADAKFCTNCGSTAT